jgi:O-antigen/teichoic acid export membrane protein
MIQIAALAAQAVVVRRIAPGVDLIPRLSFSGLREIIGFSVFSFLTYAFLMMHRESAKLVLGAQLGPTPVAHLGTPDNVAHRIHMVVASGSETLMPRFSADRDLASARALLRHGTWASLAVSLTLLVPFTVLLPDFLRLWINPEFARDSAVLGQFVALSYVSQGAYAPAAAYFRGIGRPGLVTLPVAAAGLVMLALSLVLVPRYGPIGAGYAYAAASVPAMFGLAHAWVHLYGPRAYGGLVRLVVLPLAMAALASILLIGIHAMVPTVGWLWLVGLGALFALIVALFVLCADLLVGGVDAPSAGALARLGESRKVRRIVRVLTRKWDA